MFSMDAETIISERISVCYEIKVKLLYEIRKMKQQIKNILFSIGNY